MAKVAIPILDLEKCLRIFTDGLGASAHFSRGDRVVIIVWKSLSDIDGFPIKRLFVCIGRKTTHNYLRALISWKTRLVVCQICKCIVESDHIALKF